MVASFMEARAARSDAFEVVVALVVLGIICGVCCQSRYGVDHTGLFFGRAVFSSNPEVPKRRSSSVSTVVSEISLWAISTIR